MPTRKDVVTIPANIAADHRVIGLANECGVAIGYAVYCVVMAFGQLSLVGGDVSQIDLGLPSFVQEAFSKRLLDNGRCPLYDEYNGARDRHRARCKATASKYRGKKVAKVAKQKAVPVVSGFDAAWATYPKRSGGNPRTLAAKAWAARVREGVSEEELALATKHYAAHCDAEKKSGTPYVMQGGTFYGPSQRWRDFMSAPVDLEMDEIMAEIRRNFTED